MSESFIEVTLKIPKDKSECISIIQSESPEVVGNALEITSILINSLKTNENVSEHGWKLTKEKLTDLFKNIQHPSKYFPANLQPTSNKGYCDSIGDVISFLKNEDNYHPRIIDVKNYLQSTGYWKCSINKYNEIKQKLKSQDN